MSMRMGWLLLAVVVGPGLTLTSQSVEAQPIVYRTVTVNCNAPGQSITNALKRYVPGNGLLINFSGTCNENIDILRDDITIHGTTPTATINGPNNTDSVIQIDGAKRIRLESFLVTGGRDGVNGTVARVSRWWESMFRTRRVSVLSPRTTPRGVSTMHSSRARAATA